MNRTSCILLLVLMVVCSCKNVNRKTDVNESMPAPSVEVSNEINEIVVDNQIPTNVVTDEVTAVIDKDDAIVEKNYILTPGVTYVTEASGSGTDEFGGNVSLSMEFTIYKDGSVAGNLIETNSESTYGNNHSYEHPLEGTWEEVSRHDKRFLKIDLELEAEGYYKLFTYYIDENQNAYANNVNTRPVKLIEK